MDKNNSNIIISFYYNKTEIIMQINNAKVLYSNRYDKLFFLYKNEKLEVLK